MDTRITEAAHLVEEAKADLKRIAAEVQAACPHARVYHQEGPYSTIRICADCGLEEKAQSYASSVSFVALKTEFVAKTSNVHQHRVPHDGSPSLRVEYGRYREAPTDALHIAGAA